MTESTDWQPDTELPLYSQRVFELGADPDGESPIAATLIRAPKRPRSAKGAVLYIHGFTDYFFHEPLAEFFVAQGYHFYALDLRKCGRSRRAGQTAHYVTEELDAYDPTDAGRAIETFVDDLSNWYVRRSRDRFWSGSVSDEKTDGYWTLFECLITTAKLIAPFIPFLAEQVWQNLAAGVFGERVAPSVHLCDYPEPVPGRRDDALNRRMARAMAPVMAASVPSLPPSTLQRSPGARR